VLDGERNQLIPSAPPQGGRFRLGSHTHACEVYHIPSSKTILAHPCELGSRAGRTARVDRERRVGCSMDSSCELLRSLDPASVSVHCCEVHCRTV